MRTGRRNDNGLRVWDVKEKQNFKFTYCDEVKNNRDAKSSIGAEW